MRLVKQMSKARGKCVRRAACHGAVSRTLALNLSLLLLLLVRIKCYITFRDPVYKQGTPLNQRPNHYQWYSHSNFNILRLT